MKIETRMRRVNKKLKEAYLELELIQQECPHTNLQGKYGSNTGHWCPQDDVYWIELNCPTCNKRWTVYSYEPEYRTVQFKDIRK